MNLRRYQISDSINIDARVEQVYDIAADPMVVPSYAFEIDRIEIIKQLGEHCLLVKSYLKVAGSTWGFLYRFRYRRPLNYSGVQEGGQLLRGYFSLRLQPHASGTTAIHTEGILSPIPFLAWIAGMIYFHFLTRGGMTSELARLKELVEGETGLHDPLH